MLKRFQGALNRLRQFARSTIEVARLRFTSPVPGSRLLVSDLAGVAVFSFVTTRFPARNADPNYKKNTEKRSMRSAVGETVVGFCGVKMLGELALGDVGDEADVPSGGWSPGAGQLISTDQGKYSLI